MITSLANPHIKRIRELQTKAHARNEERAFVIEGSKLFLEAPEALITEVFVTPVFLDKYAAQALIKEKLETCPYETVSVEVMQRMADTKTPQGILCVVKMADKEASAQAGATPLYLLLEDIRDPGNLGTILRTAEAVGVTMVYLSHSCADIYNPKTVRATMGSVFRLPFTYCELPAIIMVLQKQGVKIYGTCPASKGKTKTYDNCDYRAPSAFLIGNESQGLSGESLASVQLVSLPMAGRVESLNAATATAALLYEVMRQRRKEES
jgi:TrmH family RNA methyltransferase